VLFRSTGTLLAGLLATTDANPNLAINLKGLVGSTLWLHQLAAMAVTLVLSVVATGIIASILKATIGLRTTGEVEHLGLDVNEHGEEGYVLG
jgi:Amt family ammonium transporter